jgi:hypothetical protein
VADVFVIWAREVDNGEKCKVRGFLVDKASMVAHGQDIDL